VDFGGSGTTMLALHGSFGRASVFAPLAERLTTRVRLVAFDQRGHGMADHGGPFTREEFIADAAAVIDALGLGPVPLLGHSLGGITAYQLAARYPELVRALVIEDIGALILKPEVEHPLLDVRGWPTRAPSLAALAEAIKARGVPDPSYFLQSAVTDGDGCRLLFDPDEMMDVQRHGLGDWWPDWLGSRCPTLLLRGGHSMLLPRGLAADMVRRRPHTTLVEFPAAGHWIHDDDPDGCANAILTFLASLERLREAPLTADQARGRSPRL
jgi:pimeloyl-ACP methyl ester carboxylesterase